MHFHRFPSQNLLINLDQITHVIDNGSFEVYLVGRAEPIQITNSLEGNKLLAKIETLSASGEASL